MSEIINGNDKKQYKEHGRRKQKDNDNESNEGDESSSGGEEFGNDN